MNRLDLIKLEKSETIGRVLRLDDIAVMGVSSQTLAEEAIQQGRDALAAELIRYFHTEMDIMNTIMRTWIQDTMRFIVLKAGGTEDSAQVAAKGVMRAFWAFPFGITERENALSALETQDTTQALFWLERMRLAFLNVHDVLVAWMQDQLSFIAETYHEEGVLETVLHTHQDIWGDRYAAWDIVTAWEKVALTVEGMRGGHFSGMQRRGDVIVEDQGDRYMVAFDPCGSGGVLRRGDPETGRNSHPLTEYGTNQIPNLWTWQKTDVHWYCAHCAIAMEWLPARKRGYLLRPLDHTPDHNAPCPWYIYKEDQQIRDYHYPRTGSINPVTVNGQPIVYNDWPFVPSTTQK